jgi:hypothetical protein
MDGRERMTATKINDERTGLLDTQLAEIPNFSRQGGRGCLS